MPSGRASNRNVARQREKEGRSLISSLFYYGGIMAACFVLLLHVHYVVSARKLEFAIGRVMREQSAVRQEIAAEEMEISQLESIPNLLNRQTEEGIPLGAASSPPLPLLSMSAEKAM